MLIRAPLEEPANSARTPNPSKAPWYFLGLQEILVYFDPWWAGVGLPGTIMMGLIAIPYVDRNPHGSGRWFAPDRRVANSIFMVAVLLFAAFTVIGTFFRGPNWAWVWPWK